MNAITEGNLHTNEEHVLLRESALRWVNEQRVASAPNHVEQWAAMAHLGWLGLTLPEAHGGSEQSLHEACILAEELGRGLISTAYAPAQIEAGGLIAEVASPAQCAQWLPKIVDGSLSLVPAHVEAGSGLAPTRLATEARREGAQWIITGGKQPVAVAQATSQSYLVSARFEEIAHYFVVPRGTPGLTVREVSAIDGGRAAVLTFDNVTLDDTAHLANVTPQVHARFRQRATLVACAESVGAMRAALAATLEYTRTRQQFGKPLAMNQVLRHRLADMFIACEEAQSITQGAVTALLDAQGRGDRLSASRTTSLARAKVSRAARHVCEESIQLHGGMGVTEELNVARYLKRQLALDALVGDAAWHLRRLAQLPSAPANTLDASSPDPAFRDEVRAFLSANLTPEFQRATLLNTSVFSDPEEGIAWQRILHKQGWVAPAWPSEYGGTGWSLAQRWIFETECATAGAPSLSPLGLRMAGPVIMKFGTPEQKALYLPRMLAGDDYWCQGYSEPGSGSDLASLKTRAQPDSSGNYIVNGSKIWTTHAHFANCMFALVRTGEGEARKQDGISFLLIDMSLPGITVRPIRSASGDHEVNQVFFDDVRVPISCRVGDEGQGWVVAKYLLEFERGGAIAAGRLYKALAQVRGLLAGRTLEADEAIAFASVEADVRATHHVRSHRGPKPRPGVVNAQAALERNSPRHHPLRRALTRPRCAALGSRPPAASRCQRSRASRCRPPHHRKLPKRPRLHDIRRHLGDSTRNYCAGVDSVESASGTTPPRARHPCLPTIPNRAPAFAVRHSRTAPHRARRCVLGRVWRGAFRPWLA